MERNVALDITKGIGILLVIIGHFGILPHWMWKFIFSFHMPLFFIVAGYLYKPRGIIESLNKDFKRLMIPYFLTCAVILFFYLLYWIKSGDGSNFRYYLIASFIGNGTNNHECLLLGNLPRIGAIWFFPALYVCKNAYNCLNTNNKILYSTIIFIIALLLGRYVIFIPFSVLSGLTAIIFFAIGDKLKGLSNIKASYWIIGCACWLLSLFFSTVSLVRPRLDLYYVDVAGATFATLLIYVLSLWLNRKSNTVASSFSWLGRNSLLILCFHLIEMDCNLSRYMNLFDSRLFEYALKMAIPILLASAYSFMKQRLSILRI